MNISVLCPEGSHILVLRLVIQLNLILLQFFSSTIAGSDHT